MKKRQIILKRVLGGALLLVVFSDSIGFTQEEKTVEKPIYREIVYRDDPCKHLNNSNGVAAFRLSEEAETKEIGNAALKFFSTFSSECLALPRKAIYKRPEDGVVLIEGGEERFPAKSQYKIEKSANIFVETVQKTKFQPKSKSFQCLVEHGQCKAEGKIGSIGCSLGLMVCLGEGIVPFAGGGK